MLNNPQNTTLKLDRLTWDKQINSLSDEVVRANLKDTHGELSAWCLHQQRSYKDQLKSFGFSKIIFIQQSDVQR